MEMKLPEKHWHSKEAYMEGSSSQSKGSSPQENVHMIEGLGKGPGLASFPRFSLYLIYGNEAAQVLPDRRTDTNPLHSKGCKKIRRAILGSAIGEKSPPPICKGQSG